MFFLQTYITKGKLVKDTFLSPIFAHKECWGYYWLIIYSIRTDSLKREVPFAQVLTKLQQPCQCHSWTEIL